MSAHSQGAPWMRPASEACMPYVNIKITREGATAEQKAELIKGVTDLLVKVLHKNPSTTVVVIDEVETDNWGIGGDTVTVRRAKGK
jgi:4-oxalocrotonate tautomerase